MGARLIFHCLLELSRCGARGLVEAAVLLGTPVSANEARWTQVGGAEGGKEGRRRGGAGGAGEQGRGTGKEGLAVLRGVDTVAARITHSHNTYMFRCAL